MEVKRVSKAMKKASILDVLANLDNEEEVEELKEKEKAVEEREQDILGMF